MSVLRGSGRPQRPQNTPSDTRSRRDSRPDPRKSNICGAEQQACLHLEVVEGLAGAHPHKLEQACRGDSKRPLPP